MNESAAHLTVDTVARQSYGQLIAYLSARTGDVASAEDALSEAFLAALTRWPVDGIPLKPEAWLLQAARHRLIDAGRRAAVRARSTETLAQIAEEAQVFADHDDAFPEERLKLLFVCAHPAIDPAARTPLMLQTVLGIDAAHIASAFLTSPTAMSQRLVRAKTKIRDAGIPFRVPEPPEWNERLSFVLDAIYAAYTVGWESLAENASRQQGLALEALTLGRLVVQLKPDAAEASGLLALMLYCEARRPARLVAGRYVPLDEQDTARWHRPLIKEAEWHLFAASARNEPGRYQLEAAIQSVHAQRFATDQTNWPAVALLYEGLCRVSPTLGALVGRAAALVHAQNPRDALAALEALPVGRIENYQPYWATRGHVLHLLQRPEEARAAWIRAAGLTEEPAVREYLAERARLA